MFHLLAHQIIWVLLSSLRVKNLDIGYKSTICFYTFSGLQLINCIEINEFYQNIMIFFFKSKYNDFFFQSKYNDIFFFEGMKNIMIYIKLFDTYLLIFLSSALN